MYALVCYVRRIGKPIVSGVFQQKHFPDRYGLVGCNIKPLQTCIIYQIIAVRVRSDVFFAVGKTFAYSVNSVVKGLQLCAVGLKEKVVIAVNAVAVPRDKSYP